MKRYQPLLLLLGLAGLTGCGQPVPLVEGDPERGRAAIRVHGCGSCHLIPGVAGATGRVGPPLDRIADRAYLGGVVANTPEGMRLWIQHPQGIAPGTAMPDMGIGEADARDITAYLYTLR